MGRVIVAGVVGAIVVFVWGFLAWPALNLYDFAIHSQHVSEEKAMIEVWDDAGLSTGTYFIPGFEEESADATAEQREAAYEAWSERHKRGPIAVLHYREDGATPMHWSVLAGGFGLNLIGALLLAGLMTGLRISTFGGRFMLAVGAAVFAVVVSHVSNWNWFYLPNAYALAMSIDVIVPWSITGAVIAAIVRPTPTA